jgi:hypothetical protein
MSDLGMSEPAEGFDGTAAPEAASAPDPYAPVVDRVDQLAGQFDDFRQLIDQRLPQPEMEPEPDPWAALTGQPEQETYYDQYGNPVEMQAPQPGLDMNALQAAVQAQIQQAVSPYQQQMQELQTQRAHEQLVARIPQLADTPENAQTRAETAQRVQQAIASYPPQVQQALMNDAGYIETVFKAAEAEKRSQAQVPASEQVPSLEAAGGAVPGGNGEQPSYVQSAQAGAWQLPPGLR